MALVRALILAAGEGTRMRPLTLERPKPLLPVAGVPLILYSLVLLRRHGIAEVAINLHHLPEAIPRALGGGGWWGPPPAFAATQAEEDSLAARLGLRLLYSWEERILGTAGAARRLRPWLGERFLLLYGDVLTTLDLTALLARHAATGAAATLALYQVPDPEKRGIVNLDQAGRVTAFMEKPAPELALGNLANAGIYVVEAAVLDLVPEDPPYDFGLHLFPDLLGRGWPLYGFPTSEYLLDIGSFANYERAQADAVAGLLGGPGREARAVMDGREEPAQRAREAGHLAG